MKRIFLKKSDLSKNNIANGYELLGINNNNNLSQMSFVPADMMNPIDGITISAISDSISVPFIIDGLYKPNFTLNVSNATDIMIGYTAQPTFKQIILPTTLNKVNYLYVSSSDTLPLNVNLNTGVKLTSVDITNNEVYIQGDSISNLYTNSDGLQSIKLSGVSNTTLTINNNNYLDSCEIISNTLTTLNITNNSSLLSFSITIVGLTALSISNNAQLDTLSNKITISNVLSADLSGNALTSGTINTVLYLLDIGGLSNGVCDLSGGTNAGYSTWDTGAQAQKTNLEAKGWVITNNA